MINTRDYRSVRSWRWLGAAVLIAGGLTAGLAVRGPTAADFCAAVDTIPSGSSVEEARASVARVYENAPAEIRADVAEIRRAVDEARTESDLAAMDEPGSDVRDATVAFEAYEAQHCQ